MIKIGDTFGEYRIIRHINDGGMSRVWLVEKGGIEYALKVCEKAEEEFVKRFDREYRLMQNLDSKYVLKAFQKGEIDGKPCFVMEKGDYSLKDAVEKGLTTKEKFDFVLQVCDGLAFIHNNGETHRDIKPENILIKNNIVKIADFGIGRFMDRDTATLTTTTEAYSSWGYAAPELINSGAFREGSKAIDIFALGSLAYYVFSDGSLPAYFSHKQVASDIYPILFKCREQEPNERYNSVEEISKAINNVLAARGRYKSLSELDQDKAKMTVKEVTKHALPLLFKSNGIGELIENLNIFKTLWPLVYKANPQSADSIIPFILKTFEEDHSYWLQFQDTEVMARMAVLLCPAVSDPILKVKLFDLCLTSSIRANRWDALRDIFQNIIVKWDKKTILPYATYIHENNDKFTSLSEIIHVHIPALVTSYY